MDNQDHINTIYKLTIEMVDTLKLSEHFYKQKQIAVKAQDWEAAADNRLKEREYLDKASVILNAIVALRPLVK